MKKNIIKIIAINILIILNIFYISTYSPVRAAADDVNDNVGGTTNDGALDEIIRNGDSFLELGESTGNNMIDPEGLQIISNFVSGLLMTIAIIVTILSGVVMGIQFVTQSIEDKAKIKESMTPWVIGIAVSFGAFVIWEIVVNFFMGL